MSALRFSYGSIDWALDKIIKGFLNGCPPALSDCHSRCGYALKLASGQLNESNHEFTFLLLTLPSGNVAHSLVTMNGKPLISPKDKNVIRNLSQYSVGVKFETANLLSTIKAPDQQTSSNIKTFILLSVLDATQDVEKTYLSNTYIDKLLYKLSQDSEATFMKSDPVQAAALSYLTESNMVQFTSENDDGSLSVILHDNSIIDTSVDNLDGSIDTVDTTAYRM